MGALEVLEIEPRLRHEGNIDADRVIDHVLTDQSVGPCRQRRHREVAIVGQHRFGLQQKAAEVLGQRCTILMNPVVSRRIDHRSRGDESTTEGRIHVQAAVVEGSQIPALYQGADSEAVVRVAQLAVRSHLRVIGCADALQVGLRQVEIAAEAADVVDAHVGHPDQLGAPVVLEVLGACRPLRDALLVEFLREEFAHVTRRHHVGEEQADHFAPHDVLATKAQFDVADRHVEIDLAPRKFAAPVVPYRGRVEVALPTVGKVVIDAAHGLPLDALTETAAAAEFVAPARLRPVAVTGHRTRQFELAEAAPARHRRRGLLIGLRFALRIAGGFGRRFDEKVVERIGRQRGPGNEQDCQRQRCHGQAAQGGK